MNHEDVTISILTYTALAHAKRTIAAILPTLDGARLVLTANGNADAGAYFRSLVSSHPNVVVFENPVNQGFIGPSNFVFQKCITEYLVLLNDDALPHPNWLDMMKQPFARDEACIATGPNARSLDENFLGRKGGKMEFIEASCVMVKPAMIRPEPLFSADLRLAYTEDADFCLRMRQRGFTLCHTPFELIHHSGTTTKTVPELHDAMRRNFTICRTKWAHYLKTHKFAHEK